MSRNAKTIAWIAVAALGLILFFTHCTEAEAATARLDQSIFTNHRLDIGDETRVLGPAIGLELLADFDIENDRVIGSYTFNIGRTIFPAEPFALSIGDATATMKFDYPVTSRTVNFDAPLRNDRVHIERIDVWLNDVIRGTIAQGTQVLNELEGAVLLSLAPSLRCAPRCNFLGSGAMLAGGATLNPLREGVPGATIRVTGVPEPHGALLLGLSLGAVAFLRRRDG